MYGRCRVCGCDDNHACYHPDLGACSWADDAHTLCNHCTDEVALKLQTFLGPQTKPVILKDGTRVLISNIRKEDRNLIFHYGIRIKGVGWRRFDIREVMKLTDWQQKNLMIQRGNRLLQINAMIRDLSLLNMRLYHLEPAFSLS